ncbi:MAG: viperin family antiviral radical SAM protein [Nanoarchaeota archaeon]|nr:viperin family antiviral radical SAM protein [Nanoarchaeota archaeon]
MEPNYSIEGLTVNLHITRKCNIRCDYCFAVYKKIPDLSIESWIEILKKLREAKVKKINFSGGEPLVYRGLEKLLKLSRRLEFKTSIVTNGILLSDDWLRDNIENIDIMAVSLDTGNESIQQSLNRGSGNYVTQTKRRFQEIRYWSKELNHPVYLKINTMVNRLNKEDNPLSILLELNPDRVKFLQFCVMEGENDKFAKKLSISEKEFQNYVERVRPSLEKSGITVVSETEEMLWSSYLILDPQGRFCDKRHGKNKFGYSLAKNSLSDSLGSLYSPTDIELIRKKMVERKGLYPL